MTTVQQVPLLQLLDEASQRSLESAARWKKVSAGERVVEEGDASERLYILLSGRAELLKRERERASVEHAIGELGPGELVGEVGYFDRKPRPATARMLTSGEVLSLPYDAIDRCPALRERLLTRLAARVRSAGASELEAERRRAALGELVVGVLVLLCAYALLLAGLPRLHGLPSSSSYVSLPLIGVVGYASWRFLRQTGYPLADFGLGTRALGASLLESALLTAPFCALLAGVKWVLLQTDPRWRALPLFEHLADWREHLLEPQVRKLLLLYLASAVVQELTVRCALQAGLESFLLGKGRRGRAILVAAMMFAVNHLHMRFLFALLAFLPGLFWGWMFSRRRNLAGPTLSHFVVGGFVFFVLGVSLP